MELKPNMYVRTKMGKIAQLQEIQNEDNRIFYWFDERVLNDDMPEDEFAYYEQEEYLKEIKKQIIKASHNIIDLIEEGDYVNGLQIIEVPYMENGKIIYKLHCGNNLLVCNENYKVKSIVTKEMFANAEYKVETD